MNKHFAFKVDKFFAEKQIAVIGISSSKGHEASTTNFKRMEDLGYHVYPVNPNHTKYLEHKCYPSVKTIEDQIGSAMIFTNPKSTLKVLKECCDAGIKNIWIHDGLGPGSKSKEASHFIQEHPEFNVIDGACPLMFGPKSDAFHKGVGKILGWFHKLPA